MEKLLKIGITQGDINGVGYEIILKTLADNRILENAVFIIYGSSKVAAFYKKQLEMDNLNFNIVRKAEEANPRRINIINCCNDEIKVEMGVPTKEAGEAAFKALEAATDDLKNGIIDGIVTAPINKATIQSERFNFNGHTEYLQSKFDQNESLMLLVSDRLKVALATNHEPINAVAGLLTEELLLKKLTLLKKSLQRDFIIRQPRIAVLALNPHAGDDGLIGKEEINIIAPAVKKANEEGIICVGPLAADGFWGSSELTHYDAVLAMYHDQGLAPFKAIAMNTGVNFTVGLPIVRTSPDHGTAYNIAGKNLANENSFRQAVFAVFDIVKNRNLYDEINENPLQINEKN
ncbi:MAG: 4-hydroxythreonine-4-phosphate dehydrogenase PdxA [Paludibacteraceae bacterium]|jgi:4-hydroxythreonine-4-phosphate dehydrogenase|nr:4-hydroxythreonine-4-phosphate dehydrogenase PdxA [Paludibacteraceae bacterium]MBP9039592.1 4-hydroxythreonine-4-phosphate dehydrogenase PdxA [Paludibacteraceae bacterium]HOA46927.1 4-hydroxythreonine-4-phosphate dehydrogenase PdxA [Paludibacteraceae bacterium]HOG37066.1 4-hydroxythreonine-4-phosphate dehydrogenase PdxA [Paludibacteraceae bacterium]HOH70983.1 4-hydroxythreonine-4-phosphate dehydrogenase PdxA [Paludibacteraceae bacterium]